jgi:Holliday junction resolvase
MTGGRYERELVNLYEEHGWFARRAGASGGGTKSESYDLIVAKDGTVRVIELKTRTPESYIYLDESEINELQYVARQFGCAARIVTRWKQDTNYYHYHPGELYRTSSGNYRVESTAEMKQNASVILNDPS